MTTAVHQVYSPEERMVLFFRHVKKELGIPSTVQIVKLVGKVIKHVKRGLSSSQIARLVNHLPGALQLMFISSTTQRQNRNFAHLDRSFTHLDELVESIYNEDRRSGQSMFSTEVEALNAVVIILQKLDKYVSFFSYDILKSNLIQELKQIPLEDAA